MPKGQKSSASSATRKKHARKAGGAEQQLPLPKEKKKDKTKGKTKEPRVKVFIPPSKPAPVRPDPLDSMGIAKQLPPDLLVVLRRLGKKDSVTKRKALEDLQSECVDRVLKGEADAESLEATLLSFLPVWLHHIPSLLLSSSRRIRLLAAGIHASLLRIPSIHEHVVYFLRETGDSVQIEAILGSWCMATEDVDRQVAVQAKKSWDLVFHSSLASSSAIDLDESSLNLLLGFIKRALFDPVAIYTDLNPVQPAFVPSLPPHASPRNKGGAKRPPMSPSATKSAEDECLLRKPEEDEESEGDRKGRIRVGALGVLKWALERQNVTISEPLHELLSSPLLWTGLHHGPSPPFCSIHSASGFLGDSQPTVRKAAWGVLLSLLKYRKTEIETGALPTLSEAVLRSAWLEPDAGVRASMWEPLLTFLTQNPKAWELDLSSMASRTESDEHGGAEESEDEGDDGSDTSGEHEDGNVELHRSDHPPAQVPAQSEAYREFLQFLQLGCYGSPVQGYPTVIIIVSTIPPSILGSDAESWTDFLISFWAALDGRALSSLERATSTAAFLSSLLECLVLLVKRSRASLKDADGSEVARYEEATRNFVSQQMSRVWDELLSGRLRVEVSAAGKVLARTFASLEGLDEAVFSASWDPISSSMSLACKTPQSLGSKFLLQLSLLKALSMNVPPETFASRSLSDLIHSTAERLIEQCEAQLKDQNEQSASTSQRLADVLQDFGPAVFGNPTLATRVDTLVKENASTILASNPSLLLIFFAQRNNSAICVSLWNDVLKAVASDEGLQLQALPELLSGSEKGLLPAYLKPTDNEMDNLAARLIADVLGGHEQNEARLVTVRRLLENPRPFVSLRAASGLLHGIVFAFSEKSRALIRDASASASASESVLSLRTPLELILSTIHARPEVALSEDIRTFLPDFFVFGFLLPRAEPLVVGADALYAQARKYWQSALSAGLGSEKQSEVLVTVRALLRDLISDVDSRLSPDAVLQVVSEGHAGRSIELLKDLFPSQEGLDDILRGFPSNPLDSVLAIVDPLVPPSSMWKDEGSAEPSYDHAGFSEYARVVNALLSVTADNRPLARSNIWLLRHFLTLSLAASERLMVRTADSAFFSQKVPEDVLRDIVSRVKTLTSFLLADIGEEGWHTTTVQAFLRANARTQSASVDDGLTNFVMSVLLTASREDNVRETRVLYAVMQHVLNGAASLDAEQWMTLARRLEKQSPNTALAIILAVTESALEPPSLNRYRNELAAGILGIRASKANSDGLALLRRLAITAPDPDSDVVFLPQNRAVNFMKVCQTWVTSDEDIDEDVESEMTLIFLHLVPILQNVPGAHWEFVFDVIENNLENCSFADSSTLPALARTLKLILAVQDLAITNKALRSDWHERELPILTLVRDIVQKASAQSSVSVPRSVCWEMAFSIVQNLPPSLIDHESVANMVHLLLDPSPEVAKMAYALLHNAAGKRTEYLVVEAGVDTSFETTKYELPLELLQVLEMSLELKDEQLEPNMFAYLLGWMIVFDLFNGASLRVKMGYATQLRDLDMIGSSFLPIVLDLLDVYGGRSKPFQLEVWSVEEYFVQLYDQESPFSPKLLAAHLFYRALLNVPSLISSWWGSCKDRQLSTAVASLTTKHYSPVLIAAELGHVKDPVGTEELSGENWSIKIATSVGEVTASYTVDDQEMEIAVRLPSDYPLHGIEVREVKKLGVEEKKWRGWLLAVQQIVTSQNGRIVDGLSMFKKNVTHHFENQTECAICYSIISVTELSLPKKRCRTCKNRFHAGCLYKWFNTSHTSSCPLCRSDFI